ncbi:MAG: hypothetical protein E6G49_01135, partial [Actinobacteria bacterium]
MPRWHRSSEFLRARSRAASTTGSEPFATHLRRWAMTTDECRVWRERIGALVLGQLGPEERAATEAHLEGCPDCRAEADALAPMASVLRRADPERLAPTPLPPPELANRITRRIAAERRKARRRRVRVGFGLATAAAAATAAVLLALSLTGSPSSDQQGQTV